MKICIIGAGNIGLVLASTLALHKKHEVVVYTHKKFDTSKLIFEDAESGEKHSNLDIKVETDLEKALELLNTTAIKDLKIKNITKNYVVIDLGAL